MTKLTPAMVKILANLAAGRKAYDGFAGGRSTAGGLSGATLGLRRRGYIDSTFAVTAAGRAALSLEQGETAP